MDTVRRYFQRDIFALKCGIEIVDVSPGRAKVQMVVTPNHMNGVGIVHGGAIFTLADFAFAVASNSHGRLSVGINSSINFVKAADSGILTAEAWEESRNEKIACYSAKVTNEAGDTIATFQGLVYRKKQMLSEFL